MSLESLVTGDGATVELAHHRMMREMIHHATQSVARPADVFGHSTEELLDLHATRFHGGDRIVSTHSLEAALAATAHPIQLVVRNPLRELKQLIFDGNARTNSGGKWQAKAMGGGTLPATSRSTATTAPTATTITLDGVGAPGSTTFYNDLAIHIADTYGVVLSCTNASPPVLTIDKWYDVNSPGGAALATPAAAKWHFALAMPSSLWIALSTDTTTEDIGDSTLTGEFTNDFSTTGRWFGTYTLTTTPSGTGTTNSNAVYKLDAGVLTCTTGVTVTKLGLFHTQNGGALDFERKLATAATLAISDTVDPSWAITLS